MSATSASDILTPGARLTSLRQILFSMYIVTYSTRDHSLVPRVYLHRACPCTISLSRESRDLSPVYELIDKFVMLQCSYTAITHQNDLEFLYFKLFHARVVIGAIMGNKLVRKLIELKFEGGSHLK
jgi:hypothetical protein